MNSKQENGRRRLTWRSIGRATGAVGVVLAVAILHARWWRMESPGLHALPAASLGLLILLLLDSLVAFARGTAQRPREAWRWLISRATWHGAAWRMAFLGTLIVFFYTAEAWRGRMAWAQIEREAARRGERLDQRGPPVESVPDEQNVASAPIFEPLRNWLSEREEFVEDFARSENLGALDRVKPWSQGFFGTGKSRQRPVLAPWTLGQETDFTRWLRGWPGTTHSTDGKTGDALNTGTVDETNAARDVLRRLDDFHSELDQLREYAGRPYCRFPLDYPRQMWRENPANQVLMGYLRIVRLRASALLAVERQEEALGDVELALRLIDLSRQQPWAIAGLMRQWVYVDALQPVWEGLRSRRWTETQTGALQAHLAKLDLLADYPVHVRNDAMGMADLLEAFLPTGPRRRGVPVAQRRDEELEGIMSLLRLVYPVGWSLQDQAAIHQFHFQFTAKQIDLSTRTAAKFSPGWAVLGRGTSDPLFPIFIAPKVRQMAQDAALGFPAVQTMLDQAVVACALERYRHNFGRYPATLEALTPEYMPRLPHDVMTGKPPIYRPSESGYLLYSVGGNGVDDGGTPFPRALGGFLELGSGDWVWAID